MINLMLTTGRLHLLKTFVRRFTIAYNYSTKAGRNQEYASLVQGKFFLKKYIERLPKDYIQRLPYEESKRNSFGRGTINVSDVETICNSCQSCVEVYKGILDEKNHLLPQQIQVLDAIQMKIWNFHLLDLDVEQLFDLIERGILKMYRSEHLICALFMKATAKFDTYDWDAKSITRLMLTAIVFRQIPHTLMNKVHTFVCLNMKLFSLKDLTVIINALYVGKFNYGDVEFLASSVIERALKNLGSLREGELHKIIQACQSRQADYVPFLFDLAKALMRDQDLLKIHCRNFLDAANVLRQYAKFKLDVPKFVEAVLLTMPQPTDTNSIHEQMDAGSFRLDSVRKTIRLKDIGTISWALGSLAYDVDDTTGIHSYLENMFITLNRVHNEKLDHVYATDFFFGQVVAGRLTSVFIQYMKDQSFDFLTEKNNGNKNVMSRGMLKILLRVSMDIECPKVKLKEIPKGFMESKRKEEIALSMTSQYQQVTNHMNQILGGRFIRCPNVLPYIPKILEIRLDDNHRPVSYTPTQYEDLLKEMKNKKLMAKRGRRIVILIANKSTFLRTGKEKPIAEDRHSGLTLVSRRHLEKLGYESYVIKYKAADSFPDKAVFTLKKLVQDLGVKLNAEVSKKVEFTKKNPRVDKKQMYMKMSARSWAKYRIKDT